MELHPQFGEIRTVRDFLVRLALIVSGVIIAVTVTQCREQSQKSALAAQMKTRLLQEVAENAKTLERVSKGYEASKIALTEGVALCKKALETKTLDADTAAKLDALQFDLRTPPLNETQWTLALSNQSLRDFPIDEASDFASLYSLQKAIDNVLLQHKSPVTSALVETSALRLGASGDEISRGCRAITYLQFYVQSSAGNLQALLKRYAKVTGNMTNAQ
jgi:hypothetical protein